jgi:hypothetical protein
MTTLCSDEIVSLLMRPLMTADDHSALTRSYLRS